MVEYHAVSHTVLFFQGPATAYEAQLREGFSSVASRYEWHVQVVTPPSDADSRHLAGLVDFWKPIGIVVCCTSSKLRRSRFGSLPCVLVDDEAEERPSREGRAVRIGRVSTDSRAIAHAAARFFLGRGMASYACVTANDTFAWSESRCRAFVDAIHANGGKACRFDGRGLSGGDAEALRRFCAWLVDLPKPCGLFAVHDAMAATVLSSAAKCSISVPGDLNVIGVDNDVSICERVSPPLTSICIDFRDGGRRAGEMLAELISRRHPLQLAAHYGSEEIVHRLSTREIAMPSPTIRDALEAIRRRAADGISAADILPMIGGGRRTAEKRFREAVGKSVLREILDVRFEQLLPLLADESIPISHLAGRIGFTSENNLQRQFKARFGMSLSDYRKGKR